MDTELSDRDFETAIITMPQEVRMNTLEMNGTLENLSKYIEDIKKKQIEILELTNTMVELEILWMGCLGG